MSALQVKVTIDRQSPVPLYHQLAEQLSNAIAVGQLQPGDPFENEIAVAERLQISRPTVRRAIQELVDQGLLVRRRGLGTTVANSKVHRKFELTSLYDDLLRDGREPRTTVLKHELITNERAAAALDLSGDTPLLHILRVRHAGELPLALMNLVCVMFVMQFGWPLVVLTVTSAVLFFGVGLLSVRWGGTVTNPKRRVRRLPPGIPAGVTYAGR